MNKYYGIFQTVILAGAIVFSAFWIGNKIDNFEIREWGTDYHRKGLLNLEEAASYLSLDEGVFYFLVKDLEIQKSNQEDWDQQMELKFITIKGIDYYSPTELDRWVAYNISLYK